VAARLLAPLADRPLALVPVTALLAIGLTAHQVDFAACGLEHGLWGLLVLTLGAELVGIDTAARDIRVNLLCLALLLTRLDGAPFIAIHAMTSARALRLQNRGFASVVVGLLRRYGFFTLAAAGYLTAKYAYYGALLPNTFHAKSAGEESVGAGLSYLAHFFASYPHLGLALPLSALGVLRPPRTELARFARWAGASLLLYYAYLVAVGGDFMMYRLALQPYATWMVLTGLGLSTVLATAPLAATVATLLLVVASPGRPQVDRDYYMQSMEEMHGYAMLGTTIGPVLKQVLPPDTVIATTLAGTLPYYSGLRTVDQLGLSDRWVARHGTFFPRSRGHTHRATRAYLEQRCVQLVFEHPSTRPCGTLHGIDQPSVFVRVGRNRCVGAEYLARNARFTVHLCEHPEWFLLDRVRCPDTTPLRGLQLLGTTLERHVGAPFRTGAPGEPAPTIRPRGRGTELRLRPERTGGGGPTAVR
jgi:hypothetical protein